MRAPQLWRHFRARLSGYFWAPSKLQAREQQIAQARKALADWDTRDHGGFVSPEGCIDEALQILSEPPRSKL